MATNPKPIRRHCRKAEATFQKYRGHALTVRGHPLKKLKAHRSPIKVYVLIGRKPVRVSFYHWAIWFECADRHIKNDVLPGDVRVSTVFLGLDHGYPWSEVPLVFETMIFGGDHDQYQRRYATYDEALEGHKKAIEKVFEVSVEE